MTVDNLVRYAIRGMWYVVLTITTVILNGVKYLLNAFRVFDTDSSLAYRDDNEIVNQPFASPPPSGVGAAIEACMKTAKQLTK